MDYSFSNRKRAKFADTHLRYGREVPSQKANQRFPDTCIVV